MLDLPWACGPRWKTCRLCGVVLPAVLPWERDAMHCGRRLWSHVFGMTLAVTSDVLVLLVRSSVKLITVKRRSVWWWLEMVVVGSGVGRRVRNGWALVAYGGGGES